MTAIRVPLVAGCDLLTANAYSGMAQYFRGLQGNGAALAFDGRLYSGRLGRRFPHAVTFLQRELWARTANRRCLKEMAGRGWVLGGQHWVHLIPAEHLGTAMVVVFDLLALDYPDLDVMDVSRDALRRRLGRLAKAREIVTISQYSRQRIVAHLRIDPRRITVVPPGVDLERFASVSAGERLAIRAALDIPSQAFVVLYVGSEQRRKNLESLVRALQILARKMPELMFVKIGMAQSMTGRIAFQAAIEGQVEPRVRAIESATDDELRRWYAAADLFVYPSVAEGFGMPILEAMASGLPVVTTRCTSIPDVIGGCGLTVTDPYSPEQWSEAIGTIAESPQRRSELQAGGRDRAAQFDWRHSRQQFVAAWTRMLSESGAGR